MQGSADWYSMGIEVSVYRRIEVKTQAILPLFPFSPFPLFGIGRLV